MSRIVYLDRPKSVKTGGHKYNEAFVDYLSFYSNSEIIPTPQCANIYSKGVKLLSPILELKRLPLFKKASLVIFNDTAYFYHVILLLVSKLLVNHVSSVVIVHHLAFDERCGLIGRLRNGIQKLYIKYCDTIIVPSPYTLDTASRYFPKSKICYIPLPFERKFTPSPIYEEGRFLYVGTVDERKGLIYLINALGVMYKESPHINFALDVIGKIEDAKYHTHLLRRAEELNIADRVTYRGRVSAEELEEIYSKAEIFTFPSLLEGYGIVLVEAMSHGIPVVAFNNTAIPYSIKDGVNGLLAKNKDYYSLAEKIERLTGDWQLRARLQKGMEQTIMNLKTQCDFEESIKDFYNQMKSEDTVMGGAICKFCRACDLEATVENYAGHAALMKRRMAA